MGRGTPSVLEAAIAAQEPTTHTKTEGGGKVDRLLANLSAVGFDEQERLIDLMLAPTVDYSNEFILGTLATLCGEFGIGTNDVTTANLSQWRMKKRRQAERLAS